MKLSLSLGLVIAAAGTLAACSSDEGTERPTGNAGRGGAGGAPTGNAGTGGSSTAGTSAGGSAGSGGAPSGNFTYGSVLTITADGNVEDPTGASGIDGGYFLAQSAEMTVDAVAANRDGALCFSGTTAVVANGDYGNYWGAELGLDLKRVPDPNAPPPAPTADAGADGGAAGPALVAGSWPYGNVIGFSYKVEGQDPAAADKGVPAVRVRFKALPFGSNGEFNTYCSSRDGLTDQKVENILFDDITIDCWSPGGPSIGPGQATINRYVAPPPSVPETPPNPKALSNISWGVFSDIPATTPAPIPFNFCITELKTILGP